MLDTVKDNEPCAVIEVKENQLEPASTLRRRSEYLGTALPAFQVVASPGILLRVEPRFWVVSADRFLGQLV